MSERVYVCMSVRQGMCGRARVCQYVRGQVKPSEGPLTPGRAVCTSATLSLLVGKALAFGHGCIQALLLTFAHLLVSQSLLPLWLLLSWQMTSTKQSSSHRVVLMHHPGP